jgi:catechol 2,3-dioxygenase-like lactoylglutathione lyase family enzyme
MLRRIQYFCYPVADMDRAIRFYTEVLGLELVRRSERWSELRCGDQRIALMLEPEQAGEGGARLEFVADSLDDVVARLAGSGVEVRELEAEGPAPGRMIFDSEGNEIVIFEPPEEG